MFSLTMGMVQTWAVVAVASGGEVEIRDTAEAMSEQKLLDDGGKLKNFFQVGDELKLLPEVMSKLDFGVRDHAAVGDSAGEAALRTTAYWGRFYVDGWPQPIQYLRAHFGEELPAAEVAGLPIYLSDPWDCCGPQPSRQEPVILIAKRGNCTFGAKARQAAAALGRGSILVVVNDEPGVIHAPGPDAHDVKIAVVMIPEDDGEQLARSLRRRPQGNDARGGLVPVNCVRNSKTRSTSNSLCEVVTARDRAWVETGLLDGGWVVVNGDRFEYVLGAFGTAVEAASVQLTLTAAQPIEACTELEPAPGIALLARRGGCGFLEKAARARAAGAAALVVSNVEERDPLLRASCQPRWAGTQIDFPVLVASARLGDVVERVGHAQAEFTPAGRGHAAAWAELEAAYVAGDLGRVEEYAQNKWPDRARWLHAVLPNDGEL